MPQRETAPLLSCVPRYGLFDHYSSTNRMEACRDKNKNKCGWVGPQNVGDLSQWRLGGQARLFEANWWRLLFADSRPADDGRRRPLATVSFRLIATLTASNHACKTVVDLKVDLDLFFSVALYLPSRTSRIVTYIEEPMSKPAFILHCMSDESIPCTQRTPAF